MIKYRKIVCGDIFYEIFSARIPGLKRGDYIFVAMGNQYEDVIEEFPVWLSQEDMVTFRLKHQDVVIEDGTGVPR